MSKDKTLEKLHKELEGVRKELEKFSIKDIHIVYDKPFEGQSLKAQRDALIRKEGRLKREIEELEKES